MYCDVVNVQPRFNFSDEIIILNLDLKLIIKDRKECIECTSSSFNMFPWQPHRVTPGRKEEEEWGRGGGGKEWGWGGG